MFYHIQEPFPLYPGECLVGAADDGIKLNLAGVNLTYLRVFSFSVAQANGDHVMAKENFRPCFGRVHKIEKWLKHNLSYAQFRWGWFKKSGKIHHLPALTENPDISFVQHN